jgi:hypothetical protein
MMLSWVGIGKPIKIPALHEITLSLSFISHNINIRDLLQQGLEDHSIVYIRPDVQAFSLLDYHKFNDIIIKGRNVALKKLKPVVRRMRRMEATMRAQHSKSEVDLTVLPSMLSLHRFSMLNLHQAGSAAPMVPQPHVTRAVPLRRSASVGNTAHFEETQHPVAPFTKRGTESKAPEAPAKVLEALATP